MRTRLSIVAALLVIMPAWNGQAQEVGDGRLTILGKVRTYAKTDRARVTFSIKGVGKTLRAAFSDAESKIDTITTRLEAIGIGEGSLATTFFQSGENYGNKAFLSSKRDYRAVMTATITTSQIQSLKEIVAILSESDIENIQGVSFELTDYTSLREEALRRAIARAEDKAKVASRQLGLTLESVLVVEELAAAIPERGPVRRNRLYSPFNEPVYAFSDILQEAGGDRSRIFPQEVAFNTEVRVVFTIAGGSGESGSEGAP